MDGKAISGYTPGSGISGTGNLTASAPITLTASLNIGLSTVPVTKGGTGMTAVGPASTVLTSNGTILAWTPITTGGTVTSVTAAAPLQVTGVATDPVLSLQTNPTIDNPTFTTPKIGAAEGTSLKLSSLVASRLVITDSSKNLSTITTTGSEGQLLTFSSGSPTWLAPATTGTVTSVNVTVPPILQVSGGPITGSGTLAVTTTAPPQGTGSIVLANSPTLTTPILGDAEASSLKINALTASRLVLSDADKKLSSVASSGSNGQVLTISSGTPTWQTPPPPGTGTVTSVALTTGSPLFTASGNVTTSGNLSFTTASAPTGTGTQLVLSAAPTISGTTTFTLQNEQVLTFNGNNLRPAYMGCTFTGSNFGTSLSMGVNQFGRNGGNSYNQAQNGGSYSLSTDTFALHTWRSKPAGTDTSSVIMSLDANGVLQLPGSLQLTGLTASRLVLTDASKNLSTVTTAGTENQVLTIISGVPSWQSASPFSGSFTSSTSSVTVGTLNVTNNATNPGCLFSAVAPNMLVSEAPFLLIGRASSIRSSAVVQYVTDSITAPTSAGSRVQLGLYGSPALWVYGNGAISVNGNMGVSGSAIISGVTTLSSLTASRLVLTDGSKNLTSVTTAGANGQFLGFSGGIPAWLNLPTFNFARYSMLGGGAPWPANGGFYIGCKNWTGVDGIGEDLTSLSSLTLEGGWTYEGPFRNLSGRKLYVHVCWSVKRDFDGASAADIRLTTYALAGSGSPATPTAFQTQQIVGSSYACVSGIVTIENNGFMVLEGKQLSGVGNNFIDGNVQYTILS